MINRANEVLSKCTYLTFPNRERLSIEVRQLDDDASVTLFQLLGVLESRDGSLMNVGLKFTKRGECRVRIGKTIVIRIPDAGTRKEFQSKLLRQWTNRDRYVWYSEADKLEALASMEFDEGLVEKHPRLETAANTPAVDLELPEVDATDDRVEIGTIGGRSNRGVSAQAWAALAMGLASSGTIPETTRTPVEDKDLPW